MLSKVTIGAMSRDFHLDGSIGTVTLAEVRQHRKVLIFFMRDFGCMTCQQHVRQLSHLYPHLQAQETAVLVIGKGAVADAKKLAQRFALPFPVLADHDHQVYDAFGLARVLGMRWSTVTSARISVLGRQDLLAHGMCVDEE